MIPKVIHYVWLGNKEKPKNIQRCMKTWKKMLPDYEFIEWNESNFDVNESEYTKKAYEAKKYAYVSDYIRAKVIYQYGGIYFDTDILVLDNFDSYLGLSAFVGFENPNYPFTAVFGAQANHPLTKEMYDYFANREFEFDTNNQFKGVNTKSVSDILIDSFGCEVNNSYQLLKDDIAVYPDGFLCNPSQNSTTIHIFTGTWMENQTSVKKKIIEFLRVRLTTHRRVYFYNLLMRILK